MASVEGVPAVAPAAMQEGRHAARTIRARLAGRRTPGTFRYVDKGSLALARDRGKRVIASHGSLKARAYNPIVNI
jgi:NADH dehydrogenase FAD-containing subunit